MTTSATAKNWPLRALGCALLLLAAGNYFLNAQTPVATQTLKLDPAKVDFGSVAVGSHSQAETVTLTNTMSTPLPIASIMASGIDFTQTNNCDTQLAPGAQCAMQITFQPAISGPRIGTVIISTTSDPASPHLLVLNGIGQ